jgi:hypothetical protein
MDETVDTKIVIPNEFKDHEVDCEYVIDRELLADAAKDPACTCTIRAYLRDVCCTPSVKHNSDHARHYACRIAAILDKDPIEDEDLH